MNSDENARGRLEHRYCADCLYDIQHNGATQFIDVQAILADDPYNVQFPPVDRRSGPTKW
ncbi:hypothetical protein [Dictyobacter arantiisoli]|uniref:hypothetical protein n=1 Tax=Dictyobacter arantiisoli TaxID=2014874 RepID=UPI0011EC1A89|nr:hypothetical protein [Dictyobacter arantiisoli]